MTPTEQARLAEIRQNLDVYGYATYDASEFLLSLLSQETKRADGLAKAIAEYQSECETPAVDLIMRKMRRDQMFAAVRRGREGKI